jgi:hypothetical protein
MELLPLDQAFFNCYTMNIAECPNEYVLQFINMSNQDDADWEQFPNEYYSHLKDAQIAFLMGVQYGRANNE